MTRASVVILAAACTASTADETLSQEEQIAQYDDLAAELDAGRTLAIDGPAQDYAEAGGLMAFVDASAGNPVLRAVDAAGAATNLGIAPYWPGPQGSATDNINYFSSASIIASMNTIDSVRAYDAATGEELDELVVPAPPYGQKWWAYAVDGGDVYVMLIVDGTFRLTRWTPGDPQTTEVLVLDDLVAPNTIGEFTNFAVSGETLMFYESGRLWIASLDGSPARWTQNDEYVGSVDFRAGEVVYSQGDRIFRYDRGADAREELTATIQDGFSLNETFVTIHHPATDTAFVRHEERLYYVAQSGIFSFDLGSGAVEPALLDARDNSVVYRTPSVLSDGTLFVKGLESESGAIGADGPTWSLRP